MPSQVHQHLLCARYRTSIELFDGRGTQVISFSTFFALRTSPQVPVLGSCVLHLHPAAPRPLSVDPHPLLPLFSRRPGEQLLVDPQMSPHHQVVGVAPHLLPQPHSQSPRHRPGQLVLSPPQATCWS